jgi:hypothetical protein
VVKARPTFTFYDTVKYLVQCRQVKPTGDVSFGTKWLFFNDRRVIEFLKEIISEV